MTWDAIVVGAGPAGSTAARLLARAGAACLLVERKAFPRPKVCGACLNGRALASLRTEGLGPLVEGLGGVTLDTLSLHRDGRSAQLALPRGLAVSRARLDAALVGAATESGAVFLDGTTARVGPVQEGLRTVSLDGPGGVARVAARVVLLASGLGPRGVAGDASPRSSVALRSRLGAGCLIEDASEARRRDPYLPGRIVMAVGRRGYVGLVRVERGLLNVAAAFDPEHVRDHGSLAGAAVAILREAGLPPVPGLAGASWAGTPALTRRSEPLGRERLFLLGDAAGYVEPFTGEGIAWAIASAQAVAPLALRAYSGWDESLVGEWRALHRRIVGRRQRLCHAVAFGLRHPWIVGPTFDLLRRVPGAFRPFLRRLNEPIFSPTVTGP